MKLLAPLATAAALVAGSLSTAHAAPVSVTVDSMADLYNATGPAFDGTAPTAIDVTGLTSISFAVAAGSPVSLNSGGNFNDADGVGAAPATSYNAGSGTISAITAPHAGFIAGVFFAPTSSASAPAALDFTGGTAFASLSPLLQQAFFIGDGLTGDASGAVQTFYVPTGATVLYLGLTDACGYSGVSSCYYDNSGSFGVTATGIGTAVAAIPEPSTHALLLGGLGVIGFVARRRRA